MSHQATQTHSLLRSTLAVITSRVLSRLLPTPGAFRSVRFCRPSHLTSTPILLAATPPTLTTTPRTGATMQTDLIQATSIVL